MLGDNLEGWDGVGEGFRREGTHVYLWLIHLDVWQRPAQYCKALTLQLKKEKKKCAGRTQVCTKNVSSLRAGSLSASVASMVPERELLLLLLLLLSRFSRVRLCATP